MVGFKGAVVGLDPIPTLEATPAPATATAWAGRLLDGEGVLCPIALLSSCDRLRPMSVALGDVAAVEAVGVSEVAVAAAGVAGVLGIVSSVRLLLVGGDATAAGFATGAGISADGLIPNSITSSSSSTTIGISYFPFLFPFFFLVTPQTCNKQGLFRR